MRRETASVPVAPFPGLLLGSWAAKLFRDRERYLVVAINERTYLTSVFAWAGRESFAGDLARAAALALGDLGIPEAIVRAETTAIEFMAPSRLGGGELAEVLDDVQFFCEMELCYHSDLRIVQRNLNDVPHPRRDPCVPVEAVRELFRNAEESAGWLRAIA